MGTSLGWCCCVRSCSAIGSAAKHSLKPQGTQRVCWCGKQICPRQAHLDTSNTAIKQVNTELGRWVNAGTVQVAEIQAGWQKPLDVRGLTWTEPTTLGGRQLASVEQIKTTTTLLDMVKGMAWIQHLTLGRKIFNAQ